MTAKFLAVFTGILFCIAMSACTSDNDVLLPSTTPEKNIQSENTRSASVQAESVQLKPSTAVSGTAPRPSEAPKIPEAVINPNSITVTQQKGSNRIVITYPQNEINKKQSSKKNYTLVLTSGDYSDYKNAITTFLLDLYMKQTLCFDNIHDYVQPDDKNLSFLRTMDLLEALNLNLSRIDVLVLPRIEYYADGVPYLNLFNNAAAYKTESDDGSIHFGSTVLNDNTPVREQKYKQVSKGSFSGTDAYLNYSVETAEKDVVTNTTYFDAIKTKDGDFIYRCINVSPNATTSVIATVSEDLINASFSSGAVQKELKIAPLQKTSSFAELDEELGLQHNAYLFANGDGALITFAQNEQ